MKKVGVITNYYHNRNYGGMLQAYAMYKIVSNYGLDILMITFQRSRKSTYIRRIKKLTPIQLLRRSYCRLRYYRLQQMDKRYQKRTELFDTFEKSIPHTKLVSSDCISSISDDFDGFIVGSDNVWRPDSAFDGAVFLNFAKRKQYKMSYAACIGISELTEEEKNIFKKELSDFRHISVREKNSAKMIGNLTDREISYDIDPTMLINVDQWIKLEKSVDIPETYVFEYFIDDNVDMKKRIKKFANSKEMKVLGIKHAQGRYKESDNNYLDIPIIECGPREWLFLIHHAAYVFTDSFHGTVFSILYNKPFWSFDKKKKVLNCNDERIRDLLVSVDLEKRLIRPNENIDFQNLKTEISWEDVNAIVEKRKISSQKYLYGCLDEIKNGPEK